MTTIKATIARAFCHHGRGGNPAGVIIEQEATLAPYQMQAIAKELNFSETVFISRTGSHSFKALYFTPTSSIDFCGHATIAAFGVLRDLEELNELIYSLETSVGKCEVALKDKLIFLSQPLPVFGEFLEKDEVNAVFEEAICSDRPPPRIVSAGLRDIMVRVNEESTLHTLKPNLTRLSGLNQKTSSIGLHVFSLAPLDSTYTAYCRNFAPLYGIDEESATGSSNGALACYLFERGLLPVGSEHNLIFRQGDSLDAPSDIYINLSTDESIIKKVECGGEVVIDEVRFLHL